MAKNTLSHHDRYVRSIMENPKAIGEFLTHYIPENVRSVMDLDHVVLQKDSFIDDKLRLKTADLLYQTKFNGGDGFLYVLMEHASTPDKMLPFRLLKYMTAIQDHHLKQNKTKVLPFVYPIVLYTGNKKYPHSMDLFTLFGDGADLARETYATPYHLVDLTEIPDAALKAQLWFGTMSLVAKHIHDPNFLPFLKELMGILRTLKNNGEYRYIYATLTYITEAGKIPNQDEFVETVQKLDVVVEGENMTLKNYLKKVAYDRAEGMAADMALKMASEMATNMASEMATNMASEMATNMASEMVDTQKQQWIEKFTHDGFEQAMKVVAANMLGNGMTVQDIMKNTGLPESQIHDLQTTIH